ncbi:MAG: hypothetical protein ACREFP_02185 [Acetobacteraceae bacterium]
MFAARFDRHRSAAENAACATYYIDFMKLISSCSCHARALCTNPGIVIARSAARAQRAA